MLFTRCPSCETTFRITADALTKAEGRVRCGRCACVFNAHAELREQRFEASASLLTARSGSMRPADGIGAAAMRQSGPATSADGVAAALRESAAAFPDSAQGSPGTKEIASDTVAALSDASGASTGTATAGAPRNVTAAIAEAATVAKIAAAAARSAPAASALSLAKHQSASQPSLARPQDKDGSFGDLTVAQVIRQIASGTVDDEDDDARLTPTKTSADAAISERHVDEVLKQTASRVAGQWQLLPEAQTANRGARRWRYASLLASVLFGLQLVHHFRSQVAGMPIAGPALQSAYALFGSKITPQWDIGQYRVVDWVATAEPNANGQGSLKITARIQNEGPDAQPYPHVHVQLKDRWEGSIGSRFFEPSEYLPSNARRGVLMSPGATARAQLEVVDPGPDAYGFELDVCVEAGAQNLRCSADVILPSF